MEADILIGIIVLLAALTGVVTLTVWSKSRIERIAAQGYGSGRQTAKSLNKKDNQ
ncbi:MAG: hypothetical protein ACIAQZ_08915 [Sedimentisphaeraceae bacterium JB056]